MFTLRPVCGDEFVDREELVGEMVRTLSSPRERMGFALVGRRRMGKTSAFLEVIRQLDEDPSVVPVYVSLWDLVEGTLAELARLLLREVLDRFHERKVLPLPVRAQHFLSAKLALLQDLLQRVQVSVRLRQEVELLVRFARSEEVPAASELLERAFALPEWIAAERGVRCALFLDEFPTVMELRHRGEPLGEGAIRKLRTLYEGMEHTVLSISGSVRGTMDAVVLNPGAALWRQFVVREVGPLPGDAVHALLERNLARPVRREASARVQALTAGIPFYVQFLGRELARGEGEVTPEAVATAFAAFLAEEGNLLFQEEWARLSPKERAVARALARGHASPSAIAREIGDSPNVVSRYLLYLAGKGLAERKERGEWVLSDPVLAVWLTTQFAA
ncbi:ATP-binding protein [Candidatus Bipolaricaulota bacterium]|nr:ATP-binding protein [Candidatus Bipolaricaulota bacterium]